MKINIASVSDYDYGGITGIHEFSGLDEAISFIREEMRKLPSEERHDTFFVKFGPWWCSGADAEVCIYDDYI